MRVGLEASFLQRLQGNRFVYLPIIFRDDGQRREQTKIISIAGAKAHKSQEAAVKAAEKALRKLWCRVMKGTP